MKGDDQSYASSDVLTIALVQSSAKPFDPAVNLRKGLELCRTAADSGADVIVFPEMWQIGYGACPASPADRSAWLDLAISDDDPWLDAFASAAETHSIAVLVTYLHRTEGGPKNSATLFDSWGRRLLTYSKVHTCDFGWEAILTPGSEFSVAELTTRHSGGVAVGVMICYDREFPESARILMLKGAEVILTPNACDLIDERFGQFRARAYENMTSVAMANYPSPMFDGRSCIFDGIVFDHDGTPREQMVVEGGADESMVIGSINLTQLREYRLRGHWGDSYRIPRMYQELSTTLAPRWPFERDDARRGGTGIQPPSK